MVARGLALERVPERREHRAPVAAGEVAGRVRERGPAAGVGAQADGEEVLRRRPADGEAGDPRGVEALELLGERADGLQRGTRGKGLEHAQELARGDDAHRRAGVDGTQSPERARVVVVVGEDEERVGAPALALAPGPA